TALTLPSSSARSESISASVGICSCVGSSSARNGENANPWMRAGQGGSSVGRLSQAQTANVSVANTDAISRLGSIFMRAGGAYQLPVLGIDFQGSAGASEA